MSAALERSCSYRRRIRRGIAAWTVLASIASLTALGGAAYWGLQRLRARDAVGDLIVQRVTRGPFVHDVVDRGELESSANVLVRCEVQSRTAGSNGVKILDIVPEGTQVKQGDFLIKFDDATLQAERTTQQINLNSAEAAAAQSENDLAAAIIARKEYEFGEFEAEREKLNGEILVASEMASRAEDTHEFYQRLLRRGLATPSAVRKAEFELNKTRSELKTAQTKHRALVDYTKEKKISELDSKVKTAEAKLKADQAKLALEQQKLEVLEKQIGLCSVTAPSDGQVVYDHERDNWGGGAEFQIKVGTVIHEQRVVIRLPDPNQMQVVAKVAESRIDLIKPGMASRIEIEGLPGVELNGEVTRVNEYPAADNFFSANVKSYGVTVKVNNPPNGLRPGMTAKVAIRVESLGDALQVPIQAVVERGGKHYCLISDPIKSLDAREVLIGSTNEKFLVIRDGLTNEDQVLLNPRVHLARFNLQGARPEAEARLAAQQRDAESRRPAAAPPGEGPGS